MGVLGGDGVEDGGNGLVTRVFLQILRLALLSEEGIDAEAVLRVGHVLRLLLEPLV